jgi:hypothetical protein
VLYLRDVADGEADEPVVTDIEQVVDDSTDALGRLRWNQRAAAITLLAVGAGWLVAMVGLLAVGPHRTVGAATLSAVVAFAVPALAAFGRARRWPVPAGVWPGLALAAPLCLAGTGWLSTGSAAAAMLGGCVGGLVALGAVPGVPTLTVSLWLSAAAMVTIPLAVADASPARAAAVLALAGYAMALLGPTAAARLASTGIGRRPGDQDRHESTLMADITLRAHLILAVWAIAAALLIGASLVVLARSAEPYAWVLALDLAVALVLHAVSYAFLIEAVAAIVAGAAGLVTLGVSVAQRLDWPAPWSMLGAALPALVAIVVGCWLVRRSPFPDRRPYWLSGLALFAAIVAMVAALALWGGLDLFLRLGESWA